MALVYVTEAVDANYEDLATAVEASEATIEVKDAWTGVDSAGIENTETITTGAACTITVAANARNTNGYPGRAGNAYQLNATGSGHIFTLGGAHDLTISDMDILSDSTTSSDEIVRIGANIADMTFTRCHIGFSGATAEQDILYSEAEGNVTYTFTSCMFYDVGRSIVDYLHPESRTINITFNSCAGYNIGAVAGRSSAGWVGVTYAGSGATTYNIKAFNCLIHSADTYAFATDSASDAFNVDADYCLSNLSSAALSNNEDTQDVTGSQFSKTWTEGNPASGAIGLIDLTTSPYNQKLFDDAADNLAQDLHSIETGPDSGLALPSDILGTARGAAEDHDVGAFEIVVVGGNAPTGALQGPLFGPMGGPI